jgi:hypothetical protein
MSIRRYCRTCAVHKPAADFYSSSPSKCKPCVRAKVAAHREANIERIREYDRSRGFHGRPGYAAEYKAKHPERRQAHILLGNAVRSGRVVPWPVCAVPECDGRPEAHHPDYDKPLDVVWLCAAHHKQTHALMRQLDKAA